MMFFRGFYRAATYTSSARCSFSAAATSSISRQPKELLLDSSNVTISHPPPIKGWPQDLRPKVLARIIFKLVDVNLALKSFHHAANHHPNFSHTFLTYYAMIRRLSADREFQEMETLMDQFRSSGIRCQDRLFDSVIRNYGHAALPDESIRTFLRIPEFGITPSPISLNALLDALVENGRYETAHHMFNESLKKFRISPTLGIFNTIIRALCEERDMEGAIRVLKKLRGMRITPNIHTYCIILGGYVLCGDMDRAKKAHDLIVKKGWFLEAETYAILMDGFIKQGRFKDAVRVRVGMRRSRARPNDSIYGLMIEGYCKEKRVGDALSMLNEMLRNQYIPTSSTCCKLIDALCEEGNLDGALSLWENRLRRRCLPENSVATTLVHRLCEKGKVWEARKVFDECVKWKFANENLYNEIVCAFCEAGELCEAGKLWDKMVNANRHAHLSTYNALLKAFCKGGHSKEAIRILEEMSKKGSSRRVTPDSNTYSILFELGREEDIPQILNVVASSTTCRGLPAHSWGILITKYVIDLDFGRVVLDTIMADDAASN